MATITFEIPDEIIEYIKTELKVKPETYLINECLKPIINQYKENVTLVKMAETQSQIDNEVAVTKNKLKITIAK